MQRVVSKGENLFITQGCDAHIRCDGRDLSDFRSYSIENSILPHVHGSSRVKIGNTVDVVCSIKLDVTEPSEQSPNVALFDVTCNMSPSCNFMADERSLSNYGSNVACRLQEVILSSKCIDLEALCIIPGKYCWSVGADIVVFSCDGDFTDVCSIALNVALQHSLVPKYNLVLGESGQYEDFEVCGDFSESIPMPLKFVPVCLTLYKLGSVLVMDCDAAEVGCAAYGIMVAMDRNGRCCGMQKIQGGSWTNGGGFFSRSDIQHTLNSCSQVTESIFANMDLSTKMCVDRNVADAVGADIPVHRFGMLG